MSDRDRLAEIETFIREEGYCNYDDCRGYRAEDDVDWLIAALRSERERAEAWEKAVREIVEAAEALSRPGVVTRSADEQIRAVRMTNAVMAAAALVADREQRGWLT